MLGIFIALALAGTLRATEGLVKFTIKPDSVVYFKRGTDAFLKWDYMADNKAAEITEIGWSASSRTLGQIVVLMLEGKDGRLQFNPRIPPEFKGRVNKTGNATFVFTNLTKDDSTTVSCTITLTDKTTIESVIQLVVIDSAHVSPVVQFAESGGATAFICKATNVPDISWMREDKRITNDVRHEINSSVIGLSVINIKDIPVKDRGYYICNGTANVDQPNLAGAYLEVLRPFEQDMTCTKRMYVVAVNEELSICCPVTGYPPPFVTWVKNGVQLQTGYTTILNIASAQSGDFGNYTCTASNFITSLGPFNVTVKNKRDELLVDVTDGFAKAVLEWPVVDDANYHVVTIRGDDIDEMHFVGIKTYVELYYNTLVFKKPEAKPEETAVCAEVVVFGNNGEVIGKTPQCKNLTIKSGQVTLQPSIICSLLLFGTTWVIF